MTRWTVYAVPKTPVAEGWLRASGSFDKIHGVFLGLHADCDHRLELREWRDELSATRQERPYIRVQLENEAHAIETTKHLSDAIERAGGILAEFKVYARPPGEFW